MTKNTERRAIDKILIMLGIATTVVLVAIGTLAWYGSSFATGMVKSQLAAQHIYFPARDSTAYKALPAVDQQAMAPYVGQQLVDGQQAKVYADNFIAVHLSKMASGKTYAEVSNEAAQNPSDPKLQSLKATLFQGETLRGMLLGSGYAFWIFGMIAEYAAIAAFAGAAVMALLVILGFGHLAKLR